MKKRIYIIILSIIVVFAIVLGIVIYEFFLTRGKTPPFTDEEGNIISNSIAKLESLQIGDEEQWILIRGEDRSRPVLLFLHGGPGMPAMYLAHAFQRELERHFVVVHWDRRGAGKSYRSGIPSAGLTVSQTLSDTYELTIYLREKFQQERIFLVGHSWGSYLGILAARERPDYYYAFIGMGQIVADRERVRAVQREFLLEKAEEINDTVLARRFEEGSITEDDLFRFGAQLHGASNFWPLLRTGLRAPEYTLIDAWNVKRGADLLLREMQYDVIDGPIDKEVQSLDIPVFFLLGRHDYTTPSQLAELYLENLEAPYKELIWFENSAHFPFFEEPDRFYKEMSRVDEIVQEFWNVSGVKYQIN